jgi:FixJ family two-component response regulator
MNGVTLLREIRRERPSWPVLFLSDQPDDTIVQEAFAAGAYDFIVKPVDRDQLAISVKRALEVRELRGYCEKQDALSGRLAKELRQLQQIMRPLLLSSLQSIARELGDERVEQSRTIIETALELCATQCGVVRYRIEFIRQYLGGVKARLSSATVLAEHRHAAED